MTANMWTTAIGFLTVTGSLVLVRTGIKLVWSFVAKAVQE